MKKIILLLTIGLLFLSCSSDSNSGSNDSNSSSNNNVYFNFTINNKNYSCTDYENIDGFGDPLWDVQLSPNNSRVDLLMPFTNPSDNLTTCCIALNGMNNIVGTTTGCDFAISNGNETIGCFNTTVELTEVGNFYEGTFSGEFLIIQGSSSITRSGSGSFRVPKEL